MKIPVHFQCDCGVAGTILIDEDQAVENGLHCVDCKCREYMICVRVKSIDKENRRMDSAILKGKIEQCDY